MPCGTKNVQYPFKEDPISRFKNRNMGMLKHRKLDQYTCYQEYDDIGRAFLFEYSCHLKAVL